MNERKSPKTTFLQTFFVLLFIITLFITITVECRQNATTDVDNVTQITSLGMVLCEYSKFRIVKLQPNITNLTPNVLVIAGIKNTT